MRKRSTLVVLLLILGVLLVVRVWWPHVSFGYGGRWQAAMPGMDVRTLYWKTEYWFARVAVVRAEPARCVVRVLECHGRLAGAGARAGMVCPWPGAAINASYFAEDLTPIGLLVTNGRHLASRYPIGSWGAFWVRAGQPALLMTPDVLPHDVTQALECKPRLVVAGRIPHFLPQPPARRSAVGMDAQGRIVLAATDARLTLDQWAACMRNGLRCVEALNLDGGPSTQLAVRGAVPIDIYGGGAVPVFVTIAPIRRAMAMP